ncbi:MAG: DUF2220 family protein [Planctomycetota bacterium]
MWRREPHRLALLELWGKGALRRRLGQADAFDELARLPWTRRTSRRDELELVEREAVERLLARSWPGWREAASALRARGLELDEHGWRQLGDLERQEGLPALPERLNRRTATAAVAPHSKAALTDARREALGDVGLTRDGIVRLRPSVGLRIEREGRRYDARELIGVLGELSLTERALSDGTRLAGTAPDALLLVENKGTFVDLDAPDGFLVAHVPGWDTATVRLLIAQLPGVPVLHFGDLDPNGVRIVRHLRELAPGLTWVVPEFWEEDVEARGLVRAWPADLDLSGEPALVQRLAAAGRWLEQEVLALDPRLREALEGLVGR